MEADEPQEERQRTDSLGKGLEGLSKASAALHIALDSDDPQQIADGHKLVDALESATTGLLMAAHNAATAAEGLREELIGHGN